MDYSAMLIVIQISINKFMPRGGIYDTFTCGDFLTQRIRIPLLRINILSNLGISTILPSASSKYSRAH